MTTEQQAIAMEMNVDSCPMCGDTGRIQVVIEHSDTDKTIFVDECACGVLSTRDEESN
jgi:hypothetical protein